MRKKLPYIIIAILLALTIALAFFLTNTNKQTSLQNNINDDQINWTSYTSQEILLGGKNLKISTPGVYTLSGEIADGQIEVNSTGVVKLILNGVSVANSSGPALLVSEAETVVLETKSGTTNTFTDGDVYSVDDEDLCATIFSKDNLVLQGDGTLVVTGNYEDGIVSKDDLKVNSGTYEINAKDDGLRGRDSVYIAGGTLNITSGGDAVKSNNSEELAKGTILISDGALTLSAGDDGVHAESSLEINGGTISITKSYEGLEAAQITINGGIISVIASDDGLNAAGGNDSSSPSAGRYSGGQSQISSANYSITINGGKLSVNSLGDGIDSNGSLTFNGGVVTVDGPVNSANGALDAETDVIYNGGTVVALGGSGMALAPGQNSTKNSLSIFFQTASDNSAAQNPQTPNIFQDSNSLPVGTLIAVQDASGNQILEYSAAKSFSHASLSSESFKQGEIYTILLNGEIYQTVALTQTTTQLGSGGMVNSGGFVPGRR